MSVSVYYHNDPDRCAEFERKIRADYCRDPNWKPDLGFCCPTFMMSVPRALFNLVLWRTKVPVPIWRHAEDDIVILGFSDKSDAVGWIANLKRFEANPWATALIDLPILVKEDVFPKEAEHA